MQCPQCQHENRAQAKFCESCGTRLALKCAECGTELGPTARFCSECGTAVTAPASAASATAQQPTPRFTSPEGYTPQHLAERIIGSRAALEGERKQVTVLFADLKGSMELLADRDPEEARAILDPVLERMMEAVHRYEGTVNQVMGDGIMALFGAPLAHEDHAVRACYAALALQEALRSYGEQVRRTHGLELQARVGLNSGEVVVRAIGNDLRMDYSAIGQTTHLAARMEQLAAPGTIRLAPATLQLVEGLVQVHSLGPIPVKGLAEPVEVFELRGVAPTRSRLHAAATRGFTKFVGREAEVETLRRTLEQAGSGHGQLVALVGEPGVGKSRLVWEFGHSHRTQGWLVLDTRSVSYGKATSYLPVLDLLRSYCGIEARDDPRRMREKLTGKLLTLDPALQTTLPAFQSLLDLPVGDAAWEALDPPRRRQRTLDALKRWILREGQEQPVLLVFEDLHWIDSETQALLDSLVESLPTTRILLLVNYRPEYAHGWAQKTYYQQLRLDPLPVASAEELLQALLGDDAGLDALRRLLIERTEGNPFFLEESVRSLVETGVLVGEHGAYRLSRATTGTQVPATVQAVLAARIDRLDLEDKRLLQCAAVIGKDVPYPLLQAITELPEPALRPALARLQAAEFLYETNLYPNLEYTFKHALTHEVAYGSLLGERRRALHARVVEVLEGQYPDRLAEQVERLAHHALRGERWKEGVTYLQQASTKAMAHSAHREAVGYLEQALTALEQLPESRTTRELAVDLHLDLGQAVAPLAQVDRSFQLLKATESLAESLGDQHRLAQVYVPLTLAYRWAGDHQQSVEYGQRAMAVAAELGDSTLEAQAGIYLGMAYYELGNYGAAAKCFHQVRGPGLGERYLATGHVNVNARSWLSICLAEQGEFAAALPLAQEGVRLAEAANRPWDLTLAHFWLGYLHLRQGDHEKAVLACERSLLSCQAASLPYLFPFAASYLGYAYALCGRCMEALPLLEQAVERADAMGQVGGQARRVALLGEGYLLSGRQESAMDAARRVVTLTQRHKERGNEAWALRLLAEIAARANPPDGDQTESYYRQALGLAEELGMRPLAAHCHLGLGTLYQKISRDEQARTELNTAAELYRAMEMAFWLEKAEAALTQMAG